MKPIENTVCFSSTRKNPVRGGCLTGFVGGGNEGKEETSSLLRYFNATTVPFLYFLRSTRSANFKDD